MSWTWLFVWNLSWLVFALLWLSLETKPGGGPPQGSQGPIAGNEGPSGRAEAPTRPHKALKKAVMSRTTAKPLTRAAGSSSVLWLTCPALSWVRSSLSTITFLVLAK